MVVDATVGVPPGYNAIEEALLRAGLT
jgi:hypothetical protein